MPSSVVAQPQKTDLAGITTHWATCHDQKNDCALYPLYTKWGGLYAQQAVSLILHARVDEDAALGRLAHTWASCQRSVRASPGPSRVSVRPVMGRMRGMLRHRAL